MRILLTHFQIQDYGGIVNYSECMAQGLRENGHKVSAIMFKNKGKSGKSPSKDRFLDEGWEESCIADWMHQKCGWEGMSQINYRTDKEEISCLGQQYDLIIHIIPVPTCTKATKGDEDWKEIFSEIEFCGTKQIAVIHDGNMQKLYPHVLKICDQLDGIICVHDAAFNSCDVLPVRRTFIPNPHHFYDRRILPIEERGEVLISLQTFKRWKRVDDLVRAIPFMDEFSEKIICGGGIEYHYMTSKTKCKKEYMDENGNKIWDKAIANGMEYRGYVTTEVRDKLLSQSRLLVDPSWSKTYSQYGSHFNRVMIEAMAQGCVPVCTDLGMKNSVLFKSGINYLEIPHDCPPDIYGRRLQYWLDNEDLLQEIQTNNLKLLKAFDKKTVASAVLEFAFGNSGKVGKSTEKLEVSAAKKMDHFEDF